MPIGAKESPVRRRASCRSGRTKWEKKYSSNTDDTRRKFATYQRDIETGLDFAQSRYYSPVNGRFTSPDEFKGGPDELFDFEEDASDNPTFYADLTNPQSLNKYQYGYNNPYKYNDPSGHCPKCWIVAEIAGTIYDVVDTVRTFRDPNASRNEKIAAVGGTILGAVAPGAGYGKGAKTVVQVVEKRLATNAAKTATPAKAATQTASETLKAAAPKLPKSERARPPTRKQREAVYDANRKKNNGKLKCDICGTGMVPAKKDRRGVTPKPNSASIDHIKARSRGGDNSPGNLRGACRGCNRKKSDKIE